MALDGKWNITSVTVCQCRYQCSVCKAWHSVNNIRFW